MASDLHLLVVGLGNAPLPNTRHSVGHVVIDSLASRMGLRLSYDRSMGGTYGTTTVMLGQVPTTVTLLKPKNLMNILGPDVATALRKTCMLPSGNLVVIHDSIEHKAQTVSYKTGGSANGHNGVRSVITALGHKQEFHRIRIGIGRERSDPAKYVLGPLSAEERLFWGSSGHGTDLVWKQLEFVARQQGKQQG